MRISSKTVFVGGPAHGQVGIDVVVDAKQRVKWAVPQQNVHHVLTGQGIAFSQPPYEVHVYKLRKMALSKTFGKPRKIYELLIHEELWDDVREDALGLAGDKTYRALMDAVLDAMFKAFL